MARAPCFAVAGVALFLLSAIEDFASAGTPRSPPEPAPFYGRFQENTARCNPQLLETVQGAPASLPVGALFFDAVVSDDAELPEWARWPANQFNRSVVAGLFSPIFSQQTPFSNGTSPSRALFPPGLCVAAAPASAADSQPGAPDAFGVHTLTCTLGSDVRHNMSLLLAGLTARFRIPQYDFVRNAEVWPVSDPIVLGPRGIQCAVGIGRYFGDGVSTERYWVTSADCRALPPADDGAARLDPEFYTTQLLLCLGFDAQPMWMLQYVVYSVLALGLVGTVVLAIAVTFYLSRRFCDPNNGPDYPLIPPGRATNVSLYIGLALGSVLILSHDARWMVFIRDSGLGSVPHRDDTHSDAVANAAWLQLGSFASVHQIVANVALIAAMAIAMQCLPWDDSVGAGQAVPDDIARAARRATLAEGVVMGAFFVGAFTVTVLRVLETGWLFYIAAGVELLCMSLQVATVIVLHQWPVRFEHGQDRSHMRRAWDFASFVLGAVAIKNALHFFETVLVQILHTHVDSTIYAFLVMLALDFRVHMTFRCFKLAISAPVLPDPERKEEGPARDPWQANAAAARYSAAAKNAAVLGALLTFLSMSLFTVAFMYHIHGTALPFTVEYDTEMWLAYCSGGAAELLVILLLVLLVVYQVRAYTGVPTQVAHKEMRSVLLCMFALAPAWNNGTMMLLHLSPLPIVNHLVQPVISFASALFVIGTPIQVLALLVMHECRSHPSFIIGALCVVMVIYNVFWALVDTTQDWQSRVSLYSNTIDRLATAVTINFRIHCAFEWAMHFRRTGAAH